MPSGTLFYNINSLILVENKGRLRKCGALMKEIPEVRQAYLVVEEGKIKGLGEMKNCPRSADFTESVNCAGRLILPGFVDSHTHAVYAGDRSLEFEMRCAGKGYVEIAEAGGGIKRSMEQTQEATLHQLVEETLPRMNEMLSHGTTTVEIKSGYGLSLDSELKMLRAMQKLRQKTPMEIHTTFLGAHDFPPKISREKYIELIIEEMIPKVVEENLAEYCDIFCDKGFYTPEETEAIGKAAQKQGLKLRIHANELGLTGGVEAAVALKAVSADHLLFLEDSQINLLKKSGVAATLLPGTSFFLKLPYAPARRMIDEGIAVALATDANPGSCTALSMPLIQNIATTQMEILPSEALVASTLHGAASLGIANRVGSLEVGKEADFIITVPMNHFREIPYRLGRNPCWRVYKGGRLVAEN